MSLLSLNWGSELIASAGKEPACCPVVTVTTTSDTTEPAYSSILSIPDTAEPELNAIAFEEDTTEVPDKPKQAAKTVPTPPSVLVDEEDEHYEDWDTTIVHSEKFDALAFTDTVMIPLYDPSHCTYTHPFNGQLTSSFGFRSYRYHFGVDINLETGDTVRCAFDGKVRIAQYSKSYGYVVVVRHDNGLETYYAHLSKLIVKPGQQVEAGNFLGLGGNTGHSYGSHLHFEVRFKGQPINPNFIIDFKTQRLRADTIYLTQSHFKYLTETHKIVRRSRRSRRVKVSYYVPGGAHYATAEAKAIMAKVPAAVIPESSSTAPVAIPNPGIINTSSSDAISAKATNEIALPKTNTPPKKVVSAKPKTVYHTVRKGDTLSAIAKRYGTTVTKLCQLNKIKSTSKLKLGQKLRVK